MSITEKIDHTNIKKDATIEDIKKTCEEAKQYGFHGVCVNPEWTKVVSEELKGTDIKTVILVDPPMGLSSTEERVEMCKKVKEDGANETDIVMNIIDMKHDRHEKVLEDLKAVCDIAPTKVIIGSGYLTDDEIKEASEMVKEAGAICVKTATSKDPLEGREIEEKARHLKIMKDNAPGLLIKASGNIGNYEQAKKMVEAGADIIGSSSGVEIAEEESNN
ncbi:MAG: deoxyribose-phosphate aldolase [Patescibacteria group bacterium]|jgi:deoxyribose-phosphate aldolase|nr:deoxyribose-phosphate aldolase [Patescibacteria group bacterium]